MGKYLARWGFTPQKPLKKAYEQSPAAVGKWARRDLSEDRQARQTRGSGDPLGR